MCISYNNHSIAEKENISALAQLATGLAVASVGGDVGDVSTGIAAGKNAVENNYLLTLPLKACVIAAPCKGFIAKKILEYSIKAGITAIVAKEIADNISSEDLDHLITLKLVGNDEITNRYLVDLADKYATTTAKDPNDEPAINNPVTGSGSIAAGGALGLPFDNEGYPIPEPLPPLPGYQPLDPEELGPNHTGHGGGLDNIEFPNHTGGNQIPEPLPPLPGYEPLDPAWINNVFTADSGKGSNSTSSNPIINPATNKVVTEHIIVPSGKAPKTSTPNSIYEVSRSDGSRSVTYYDERGNMFSREDYGQQRIHGNLEFDNNGKVVPHEHKQTYKSHNGKIYKDKSYYRQIDENGKPVGPWILDK